MAQERVLFTTLAGATGVGITVPLILMVTTASQQIRYSHAMLCTSSYDYEALSDR
jgi:hypothetical protein